MHQYFCTKCGEPVSDEMEKPALETNVFIVCAQCLFNWLMSPPVLSFIDLANYQELDLIRASELDAQFSKE